MLLTGADVFDGSAWHPSSDLEISDGVITRLGPALSTTLATQVVDVTGNVVVPGFVDAHVHLFPGFLARLPAFGITAAVDMFATPRLLARLRVEGRAPGSASFVSAGTGAAPAGGHPHQLADQGMYDPFPPLDRAEQVENFVAARLEEGAGFVKVFLEDGRAAGRTLPVLGREVVEQLVDTAHSRGLAVLAHATSEDTALVAVAAGVDGLAHVPMPGTSTALTQDLVDAVSDRSVFVVSTLVSLATLLGQDAVADALGTTALHRLGPGWRAHLEQRAGPRDDAAWDRVLALTSRLVEEGATVLPGTDAAFPGVPPGASLAAELALLEGCGVGTTSLLTSATAAAARAFGLPGGHLVPGAPADLVVLGADPRLGIDAVQEVTATVVRGELLVWPDTPQPGERP